jgi:hypothetical protein
LSAVIIGAVLLSAAPFSFRLSPERGVSLSMNTAAAIYVGGRGPRGHVTSTTPPPPPKSAHRPR